MFKLHEAYLHDKYLQTSNLLVPEHIVKFSFTDIGKISSMILCEANIIQSDIHANRL